MEYKFEHMTDKNVWSIVMSVRSIKYDQNVVNILLKCMAYGKINIYLWPTTSKVKTEIDSDVIRCLSLTNKFYRFLTEN